MEVALEGRLVERQIEQFQDVVFEVLEVPQHRLLIETFGGKKAALVKPFGAQHLQARQLTHDFPEDLPATFTVRLFAFRQKIV